MQSTEPRILDHTNYRSFLKSYYDYKKRTSKGFSYEVWARKLGLKNNTSILKIIRGDRNAGPAVQEKLIQYFQFQSEEIAYFRDLVLLEKMPEQSPLRLQIIERLSFRYKDTEFQQIDENHFVLLADWWHWAIRQLLKFKKFKLDSSHEIAKSFHFKVSPKEVDTSIKRLMEFGFIKADEEGVLISDPQSRSIKSQVCNEAIRSFHGAALVNAQIALRDLPVDEREFNSLVLAVRSEDFGSAKEEILEFVKKFNQRFSQEDAADSVYQLEVALFPLTSKSDSLSNS